MTQNGIRWIRLSGFSGLVYSFFLSPKVQILHNPPAAFNMYGLTDNVTGNLCKDQGVIEKGSPHCTVDQLSMPECCEARMSASGLHF